MDWKETAIQEVFERRFPTVLLGSGSSISTSHSLGLTARFPSMADLAKRFLDNINPLGFSAEDHAAYQALSDELTGLGADWHKFNLESFLAEHPLKYNSIFLNHILEETSEAFKAPHDELSKVIEQNPSICFPLREMFEKLLRAAPAGNPELCIYMNVKLTVIEGPQKGKIFDFKEPDIFLNKALHREPQTARLR